MLVVSSCGVRYGIPVEQVRHVLRPDSVTRVPGAPAAVWGIVNVRGAVVTVTDLGAMLGSTRAIVPGPVVVLARGTRYIGLAVDAVHDVERVDSVASGAREPMRQDHVRPLDAVALCAGHVHISEEMAW